MNGDSFDELLELVGPYIRKQDTVKSLTQDIDECLHTHNSSTKCSFF